ncbi:MAG: hypothetical protein WC262_08685 [Bacteroidales bacterium]|jgi:hypothetical protein
MFNISTKQIIVAIGIGIILSFFFVAITLPQTVEQPGIEITPVSTPEPVYVEETSEPMSEEHQKDLTSDVMMEALGNLLFYMVILLLAWFSVMFLGRCV